MFPSASKPTSTLCSPPNPIAEKKMQMVNDVEYAVYPATQGGQFIGAAVEATALTASLNVFALACAIGSFVNSFTYASNATEMAVTPVSTSNIFFKDDSNFFISSSLPPQSV